MDVLDGRSVGCLREHMRETEHDAGQKAVPSRKFKKHVDSSLAAGNAVNREMGETLD